MRYIEPAKLKSEYDVVRPLNRNGSVLLVRSRETGRLLVQRMPMSNDIFVYKTISALALPGIPSPLFFSETESGFVILEEYIEGKTLKDFLRDFGPMNKDLAFDYLTRLCDILAPLHNHDPAIVHRDIKPSNILVTPNRDVYLLDFDAATYYIPAKDRDTVLLGTEGYAAPEQYGFNASNPRTDVYALGKLGMELITGEAADANSYSGPYRLILNRCASMDPNDRYENASALKHELLMNRKNASGLRIPGYRSGNKSIAVIASLIYAIIPFFGILNLVNKNIPNFIYGCLIGIGVVVAAMIIFNYRGYLLRLPGTRSKSLGIRYASTLFYIAILLFILFLILGLLTEFF